MTPIELDPHLYTRINRVCEIGDTLAEEGKYNDAIASYQYAWDLLPDPKEQWEAATWILVAIGDAHFLHGNYFAALNTLEHAMHCPDAIGNPFIHLRLGQAQLEMDNRANAADELMRAYMGAGAEIFAGEAPKYLEFLGTVAEGIEKPRPLQ